MARTSTPFDRVVISFLTAYMISAGEQWSAIYTSQTLGAGATLGAATYAGWVLANAVGLLVVDRVTARVGLLRFFCVAMVIAAVALAVALAVGTAAAAIAGFVLLGLGTIGIAPLLNGLAAQQPGLTPGEGLSIVQLGQPPGFSCHPHSSDSSQAAWVSRSRWRPWSPRSSSRQLSPPAYGHPMVGRQTARLHEPRFGPGSRRVVVRESDRPRDFAVGRSSPCQPSATPARSPA